MLDGLNLRFLHMFRGAAHAIYIALQLKLDGSNTDGSFTMANSNSVLESYKILPIAQENKYEGESISNQSNLFPVEIHLFFFDVIAF